MQSLCNTYFVRQKDFFSQPMHLNNIEYKTQ